MVLLVLFLVLFVPLVLLLVRWMMVHRKAEMRARVHVREYFAALGASAVAQRRLQSSSSLWKSGEDSQYDVHPDTAITIAITLETLGPP